MSQCSVVSLAGESHEVSLRDSWNTSEPITSRRGPRREEQSGKHQGSHGLLRVVDLGRIDTDSVLMWQLSVQHGRRAAPLGMCFVYKQTAPRRPGKRSVPADCWRRLPTVTSFLLEITLIWPPASRPPYKFNCLKKVWALRCRVLILNQPNQYL